MAPGVTVGLEHAHTAAGADPLVVAHIDGDDIDVVVDYLIARIDAALVPVLQPFRRADPHHPVGIAGEGADKEAVKTVFGAQPLAEVVIRLAEGGIVVVENADAAVLGADPDAAALIGGDRRGQFGFDAVAGGEILPIAEGIGDGENLQIIGLVVENPHVAALVGVQPGDDHIIGIDRDAGQAVFGVENIDGNAVADGSEEGDAGPPAAGPDPVTAVDGKGAVIVAGQRPVGLVKDAPGGAVKAGDAAAGGGGPENPAAVKGERGILVVRGAVGHEPAPGGVLRADPGEAVLFDSRPEAAGGVDIQRGGLRESVADQSVIVLSGPPEDGIAGDDRELIVPDRQVGDGIVQQFAGEPGDAVIDAQPLDGAGVDPARMGGQGEGFIVRQAVGDGIARPGAGRHEVGEIEIRGAHAIRAGRPDLPAVDERAVDAADLVGLLDLPAAGVEEADADIQGDKE